MESAQLARDIVHRVIDDMNREAPAESRLDKSPTTALFGPGGSLDSLGLVDLVMQIQEAVLDDCGVAVAVADQQVLNAKESPFSTVETLIQHVERLLANEQAA